MKLDLNSTAVALIQILVMLYRTTERFPSLSTVDTSARVCVCVHACVLGGQASSFSAGCLATSLACPLDAEGTFPQSQTIKNASRCYQMRSWVSTLLSSTTSRLI